MREEREVELEEGGRWETGRLIFIHLQCWEGDAFFTNQHPKTAYTGRSLGQSIRILEAQQRYFFGVCYSPSLCQPRGFLTFSEI